MTYLKPFVTSYVFIDNADPLQGHDPGAGEYIHDSKMQVMNSMPLVTLKHCLFHQYDGYLDDPTIKDQ